MLKINKLNIPTDASTKLQKRIAILQQLVSQLNQKLLPEEMLVDFNRCIDAVYQKLADEKACIKLVRKTQSYMLNQVVKKMKWIPKNYYRNLWMALGISVFGVPMGVLFGAALGNMAYMSTGIPIGMVIGIAIGSAMDKKAQAAGRQLNLEIEL